ncbi:uncharacterized protein RHIMIDRAFT_251791 [Rhizopus microsporus ATCC 52813]|uniref:RING-type E3 ubiquitin transferase n=1 Tax=Rhizopus microsporus ATCC 52813 TaxID=1340429 RepID=A0A2G4STA0_RHIZD|nr:uncharacterized protein RHIMIDRAFT_251791 [Rhizopus microsporus ATCC 52813]PHZ11981.1 hypothetical protein RHIMIDRAFT_251791 [Rhizopus microsporus ATCC 52813]
METSSQPPTADANQTEERPHRRRNHTHRRRKPRTDNTTKEEKEDRPKKREPLKGFKKDKLNKNQDSEEVCFICTEPIDYYAVAPCDHRTCHMCTLRLRVLYHTKNCAYCKAEAKRVVFTNESEKPYEEYKREDTPFYDRKYGIRFETEEMFRDTQVILQYNCPDEQCEAAFSQLHELKKHVKQVHERILCDLCLRNKKIFSHEHTMYTNSQLQKHHREGDASFNQEDESGFTGHPECVFCRTRFYGSDELFEHCRDKHEQCHLCVRNGVQHQYYANYESLEKHFQSDHYLCMYKECLNNKFVVFDTDIDLKAHEQTSSKIRLIEDDFPSINGSTTAVPLVTHRMQSLQLIGREEWPSLGEGRSSPSSSATTPEPSKPTIISRQAAALDRVADTLRNLDKMLQFRKYINQYTKEMTLTSEAFVDSVHELCNKDMKLTSKVLEHTKDMIDHDLQKADLERVWNHKKNPSAAPQVLTVNPRKPKVSNKGVWGKVALAARDAGAFPPLPTTRLTQPSPWSSSAASSRTGSEQNLQDLFPALPTSSTHSSRRADINAMLRKKNDNRWSNEPYSSTLSTDTDSQDESDSKQKKKKKGKQVLFRVGL